MRPLRSLSFAVSVLSLVALATGCAPEGSDESGGGAAAQSASAARVVSGSTDAEASYVDRLAMVHRVALPRGAARVYELLGGDGMNAMRLAVAVDAPSGETSTWILDTLMFSSVEKAEALGNDGLRVEIVRDTIELDGQTEGKERLTLELRWKVDGRGVSPELELVEGPLAATTVERATDRASAQIGSVLAVKTKEHDGILVVAASARRPDGAATVLLSLGDFYSGTTTFDLDLRVEDLASVDGAGPGKLRVTSAVADETGRAPTVTHEVAFTKTADGVAPSIRVTPTR